MNIVLSLIISRTGKSKVELKVCESFNESNFNVTSQLAEALNNCTSQNAKQNAAIELAIKRYEILLQSEIDKSSKIKETLNEKLKDFNKDGDCVYPDDVANILFTESDL